MAGLMAFVDIFADRRPKLGHIVLDATTDEQHEEVATASSYPVEDGADRSDHIHHEQSRVSLSGLISNTEISSLATAIADDSATGLLPAFTRPDYDPARHITAWQQLVELKESDEIFTFVSSLRTYPSMRIASLVAQRDQRNTDVLRFSATLERWRVAYTSVVEAAVAEEIEDMAEATAVAAASATSEATAAENAAALEAIANGPQLADVLKVAS